MVFSKEECRSRYVIGDKISLQKLSTESGVALRTLQHWSAQDGWMGQRSAHAAACVKASDIAIAAETGKTNAQILEEHYQTWLELESVGKELLNLVDRAIDELESPDPYKIASLGSSKNQASNIIKTSIAGQRQARGLDYEDLNYAIAAIRKQGYRVIDDEQFERYQSWLNAQDAATNRDTEAEGDTRSPVVVELLRSLTGETEHGQ